MPDEPLSDMFRKPDLNEITENWNRILHTLVAGPIVRLVAGPIVRLDLQQMLHHWDEVSEGDWSRS